MMAHVGSSSNAISLERQVETLIDVHSDCCIYVVPENLRKVNEDAYRPLLVSIGPVYDGKLADMQQQKLRYLKSFQLRYPKYSISQYLAFAKGWGKRAKESYIETIKLPEPNSREFVEMLLLDAAFIIELFMRNYSRERVSPDDRIFNKPKMHLEITRDIRLQENQLPFFILRDLYTRAIESPSQQQQQHPSLLYLTCRFFRVEAPAGINPDSIENLVDFLRKCYLPTQPRVKPSTNNQKFEFTSSVTRLYEAGVKFVARGDRNLLDITFTKGVLEMPKLRVTDDTESLFRNIMVFEQFHHFDDSYIIDYFAFLNSLISTPEDVEILAKAGIIDNWLGNNEEVADLFSKLFKEIRLLDVNFYYSGICGDLNAYSRNRWPRWRAILNRNYFHHPWAIIAVVYAIFMLLLTILQVATGFLSIHPP